MTYEMLDKETLTDLIRFAGGLTQDVYPDFIQIQRYVNGEEKLLEWKLADVLSNKQRVDLVNGDIIRVKPINKPMDTYVDIQGSVYYPGRFDLGSNQTLKALIAKAMPNERAKADFLLVERTRPDATIEVITVPFPGYNGAADFPLKERDRIHILDQATYSDVATISVNGQVRKPFTRELAFGDRLTVSQALELAGGLKPTVYPVAYIFRKNLLNPVEVKYIRIELDKSADTPLQPGDQLNIYDNTTYTNVGELKVFGAVKNPGTYTYDQTMNVRDLLINAGGFNVGAAYNRVEVFRTVLSPTEPAKLSLITLTVDSNYQVVTPEYFTLQPYDQLVVRMTPNFTLGRTVEITGQVKYPGTYVLESKQTTLAEVIKLAGGLLKAADPYGAQLFRTYKNRGNVSIHLTKAVRHPNNEMHNPILFEGDVINIGRKENTVRILENGTRMANYVSVGETDSIKNVVFQGKRTASWYIRNFAGGFQKNADRNSVTVTYANNQMQATKRFLIFFRVSPIVQPGATIALRMDPEKVEAELKPEEKMDFETTVSKTLSVLTSTLSIILLVKSLNN
jgi:protein involved in polysaccharide export with SLBB domain